MRMTDRLAALREHWQSARESNPWATNARAQLERYLQHRILVVALAHSDHQAYLGGTQLYMQVQQQQLAERDISFVSVWPWLRPGWVGMRADGVLLAPRPVEEIVRSLTGVATSGRTLAAIDIHHLKGWPLDAVRRLALSLSPSKRRLFIHDFHLVCTNPNLTFGDRIYCSAPPLDSQACRICRYGPSRRDRNPMMEAFISELADQGTDFIAPSPLAADIWLGQFPLQRTRVRVVPHQELVNVGSQPLRLHRRPTLAFVGVGLPLKGLRQWSELIASPDIRRRFDVVHIGRCKGCAARHIGVDFRKDGFSAMLTALTAQSVDFAFLWSIWPEAFSFTCYEAIAAGAYLLTNRDSGNIAAMVTKTGRGRVFEGLASVRDFLDDEAEVARTRGLMRSCEQLRLVWSETLSKELV